VTTYRRTWTLLGHSNGEGFAGSSPLYTAAPHLAPFGPAGGASSAAGAALRVHPGLKMFMSDLPWPDSGGTPPSTLISAGAWKDMTLDIALSPTHPHPYSSPYQYPSGRSVPFTPDAYRADGNGTIPFTTGGGALCGVELPFAHGLSQYCGEEVYGIKLSIPSTYMLRFDAGSSAYSNYAWWTPQTEFDFDPATGRLYTAMLAKMAGAQAALPAGERLDVHECIFWMGDNDSALSTPRIVNFKVAYKNLIAAWRRALVANQWTTLPVEQIRIIVMGIYTTYGTPNRDTINEWLQEMEDEDPYLRYLPTMGYESLATAGYSDASHISHNGYLAAAADMIEAIQEMDTAPLAAMDTSELVDVSEVRSRVRVFYENNRVRTGATSDDNLLVHINGSLQHIHSKLGDQCYWLRKREEKTISVGTGQVFTMERNVNRVLKIENPLDPGDYLRFKMIGHVEGGKVQLQMLERCSGTYTFIYIENPRELSVSDQKVPMPRPIIEWLVTEVCYRVARTTPNQALIKQLEQDCAKLHLDVARHCASMIRARNDQLHVQRHLRGRIGSYGKARWPLG
jgi:hypothetical protein